ncbi:hypothetical protein [Infirmifilum sp.]
MGRLSRSHAKDFSEPFARIRDEKYSGLLIVLLVYVFYNRRIASIPAS